MKTILIATDFSTAAQAATRYGFTLARTMQAKIILLNSYFNSSVFADPTSYVDLGSLEQTNLAQLEDELFKNNCHGEVVAEIRCTARPVIESVLETVSADEVDLIIVGVKEKGKEIRRVFGNTITALINKTEVPVLVVPEKANISLPEKIALSSNLNNEQIIDIVRPLKELVEKLKSAFSIVRVIDKNVEEPYELLMKCSKSDWFLQSLKPEYEFLKEDNVGKAVISYALENSVDLIAIIAHHHNILERIFNSSVTEYFLFHSVLPLLILPAAAKSKAKITKAAAAYCSGSCMMRDGVPKCDKYQQMHYEYQEEIGK